eukprot:Sdes_comp10000_c0_seq1m1584
MNEQPEDLLLLFQSMGTTDHDLLISQFQQVSKCDSSETCRFFLEANNWSLQNAIASYFDNGGRGYIFESQLPQLWFSEVDTEGRPIQNEKSTFPMGSIVLKYWLFKNTGTTLWPCNIYVEFVSGNNLGAPTSISLPQLRPDEHTVVTVEFIMPDFPGNFAGTWRIFSNDGVSMAIGEPIWVCMEVVEQPDGIRGDTIKSTGLGPLHSSRALEETRVQEDTHSMDI